jgi:O-antigen/teichoic acid export membrane protein
MTTSGAAAPTDTGDSRPYPDAASADLAGRDRMAHNVLWSWGAYLVIAVTGFVVPRLVDRHVGQAALGIWDFSWSLVSYFRLAQIGVGPSVNRYVARHQALGDLAGLRQAVSSVTVINLLASFAVLVLTAAAVRFGVPLLLAANSPELVALARWVVGLLGLGLAVEMAFDVFPGVITGCHRWDLHNAVNTVFDVGISLAFVVALMLGGGLRSLAIIHLVGVILTELTRASLAYRVCPGLRLRLGDARAEQARRMIRFGLKSSAVGLGRLLLFQANSLIVASQMGAAALAVFARPLGLLRVVETFANKFAFVLTPTASSLQASGRREEVRALALDAGRLGAAIVLPMLLGLIILGDPILRLWMGDRYDHGLVLAILAVGCLAPFAQRPMGTILIGLNQHGAVAVANLAAAAVGLSLGLLNAHWLGWGLAGAALAVGLPFTGFTGAFLAIYGCRRLGIPLREYLRRVLVPSMACAVPFALTLATCHRVLRDRPLMAVLAGSVAGAVVLAPLYWRWILSPALREQVRSTLRRVGRGSRLPAPPSPTPTARVEP